MEQKKLLVVVDMQNDFITGALGTAKAQLIVDNVVGKIAEYKKNGGYIVYTMDTHGEDYLTTQEGCRLPVPHCLAETKGWKLNERVAKAIKDAEISGGYESPAYHKEVFGSWDLVVDLKKQDGQFSGIEIIGVCTGICVIANVVLAKTVLPEVPVIVDASCCACVTPESHETALNAMALLQVDIINR